MPLSPATARHDTADVCAGGAVAAVSIVHQGSADRVPLRVSARIGATEVGTQAIAVTCRWLDAGAGCPGGIHFSLRGTIVARSERCQRQFLPWNSATSAGWGGERNREKAARPGLPVSAMEVMAAWVAARDRR